MKPTHRTKIRSGYIIAFLLMLVSYFLIFYIVEKLVKGTQEVADTNTLINRLESLRTRVLDAEAAVKGYIITMDAGSLIPYYVSQKAMAAAFSELRPLGIPEEKFTRLKKEVDAKMVALGDNINNFQASGLRINTQTAVATSSGERHLKSIRELVDEIKKEAENNSITQHNAVTGFFSSTYTIAITSMVIAILTGIFFLVTYNREKRARDLSDHKARAYHTELETRLMELNNLNAELKELKEIEKFAATGRIARTIAHEVRNPLTNISLAAEQLQETFSSNEESALLLDMVSRNAARIDHLVADLLHSTRFAQLDFVKVDINKLLDETLLMAQDRIGLKNVQVVKEYSDQLCDVLVDPEKMKLAFLNIIVNGIEAVEGENGKLILKTLRKKDRCIVEIIDNGSGMDEDTLQKIFDPYFTGKSNGTGLGLTNSQNIIFNHKGKVFVNSEPGKGARFRVILDMLVNE
jgi:signal transduction histidine kinase